MVLCGNKLVATRDVEEEGIEYKVRAEIKFKKDEVSKMKITCKMDSEDDAKKIESSLHSVFTMAAAFSGEELNDYEIKRNGKKVTMELEGESAKQMTSEWGENKEEIKEELEEQGFKVK